MMNAKLSYIHLLLVLLFYSCNTEQNKDFNADQQIAIAAKQAERMLDLVYQQDKLPRSLQKDRTLKWTKDGFDWTEGFYPGFCWYLYEATEDEKWKQAGVNLQAKFVDHRFLTVNHDLGFIFNCSFGNAYRIMQDSAYKQVLVDAANSLIKRYNPNVACIQSWNVNSGWQSKRGWQFPVIIDNMMNLELLFEVSRITGNSKYKDIAINHANTTLQNHFRDNFSSYHVLDYDTLSGSVRKKNTAQGYADESSWARGQAWGLYGFTLCYRYTKNSAYLKQAEQIANFILTHPDLPADMVPYWDFDAPGIPDEPRDAAAAAVMASGLLELDAYSEKDFRSSAITLLKNLSSERYFAEPGTNHNFLLKHGVGSIPHRDEIDVPLIYADYYYIEALLRLNKLYKTNDSSQANE